MGSFVGSMCLCLHLSVWVVLTPPSAAFYLKWRAKAMRKDGKRVWCEWWNNDLHIQVMYKQRAWLEGAFPWVAPTEGICVVDVHCFQKAETDIQELHLAFFGGKVLFFPFFEKYWIILFILHFRLGKTWRFVCIQIINLDLSLEGERLICYVLETWFDFPFFFFQRQREMLVLSRLSL